ncbi:MAG TPA: hypothetical protein VFM39_02745 [bacterium]|nr:hypothetical protein [bacterium]
MTRLAALLNVTTAIDATTLGVSLVVAEFFYKFHSFTLEALAFLATWYVLRRGARFFARVP